mmetsp:Transcript_85019/g.274801  ORF Transcript_85019/g.274801 Transcript_85019/m.274801 type:complete len:368 (-) Transcript_85019:43-1146(-)
MDLQACLGILNTAAAEHERLRLLGQCCEQGCLVPGRSGPGFCKTFGQKAPVDGGSAEFAPPPRETGGKGGTGTFAEASSELTTGTSVPDETFSPPPPPPPPPPPVPAVPRTAAQCRPSASGAGGGGDAAAIAAVAEAAGAGGAGQLIDLETGKNETVESDCSEAALLEMFPDLVLPRNTAAEDFTAANAPFAGANAGTVPDNASSADLAAAVCQLHEERVKVYRAYDGAFRYLLKSQSGGAKAVARTYPAIVAKATARFQLLSTCARLLASTLEDRASRAVGGEGEDALKEAARLIRKVQGLEQARLQLVAMHHIEQSQLHASPGVGGGSEAKVARVKQQLDAAAEEIEDMVSELRYAAAELRECAS